MSGDDHLAGPVGRYVSHRSLLMTGRAIKRSGNRLLISTAGDGVQVVPIQFVSKTEASRNGSALFIELKKARSDYQYNQTLAKYFSEIRSAWPEENKPPRHVHHCETNAQCQLRPDGVASCGFDWNDHKLDPNCDCGAEVDWTGQPPFIVHRDKNRRVVIA
jgi:hypothetical protein